MSDEIKKTDDAEGADKAKNKKAANGSNKAKKAEKKAVKKNKPSKGNIFVRMWRAIVRFFKNTRGEVKKIIWPSRKMVWKSTGVVIAVIIVVGAGVWLIDYALSGGIGLVKNTSDKAKTTEVVTDTTESVSDVTEEDDATDTATDDTTESTAEDDEETTESTTNG